MATSNAKFDEAEKVRVAPDRDVVVVLGSSGQPSERARSDCVKLEFRIDLVMSKVAQRILGEGSQVKDGCSQHA